MNETIEFLKYLKSLKRLKGSTITNYKYFIYRYDLEKLFYSDFQTIKKWLINSNNSISIKWRCLMILRSWFAYKGNKKMLEDLKSIMKYKGNVRDVVITEEEFKHVYNFIPIPYNVMAKIYFTTGIRRTTLLVLKYKDFDLDKLEINIKPEYEGNKAKIPFCVGITEEIKNDILKLKTLFNVPEDERFFIFIIKKVENIKENEPYKIGQIVTNRLMLAARRSGLKDKWKIFTPHSLRHSYATRYLKEGGKIENLSYELGHKDIKTTQRYVHERKEAWSKEIEKIGSKVKKI